MTATHARHETVAAKLSTLDRWLPAWIILAMVAGLLVGRMVPGLGDALSSVEVDGISLPIALGLLVMMYPVLAKVRYDRLDTVTGDRRLLIASLALNWIVGPALMFALAWLLLPDLPAYRTGLIIVGLARCIAMVIIWNDVACGDREAAAVLVALNSIFQVIAFAALGWFYLSALPGWLGLEQSGLDVSAGQIAKSVLIFLGIPLLAGYLSRRVGEKRWGRAAYEEKFVPRIGPWALYGLLFTIVILFALQGDQITSRPSDVARIALPLLAYAPPRLPSPPPATTSSWQSPSPSRPSAPPPARPSPASSARSSRSPSSWLSSMSRSLSARDSPTPSRRMPWSPDDLFLPCRCPPVRSVRLRPQRRPLADGRGLHPSPLRRSGRGALGGLRTG